ncbi:hypothetical protein M3Y99_00158000 [Aphelenchoides fujianensis]|nr:hypothetical protein M3Y99_00158000 [Aphelenchoides fujianensis]
MDALTNAAIDGKFKLYGVHSNDRICCRVWTNACGLCAQLERAAKKAVADAQSQFEDERSQLEAEIEELKAKLHESSQVAGALESELIAVQQENHSVKVEKKSAARIFGQTAALQPSDDNADERSDSSSSSEWEPVDAE